MSFACEGIVSSKYVASFRPFHLLMWKQYRFPIALTLCLVPRQPNRKGLTALVFVELRPYRLQRTHFSISNRLTHWATNDDVFERLSPTVAPITLVPINPRWRGGSG